MHWPRGFGAKGEIRSQFHHVTDIAPTVLEAAGIPEPTAVDGVTQRPIEGVSMRYSFDEAGAPDRRTTQYFEMFCNRGIYHEGWTAVTRHSTPWVMAPLPPLDEDVWELYDTTTDWSQARDVAAEHPDKLAELQERFLEEARRYNVLLLDDRRVERFNPDLVGRPTLIRGSTQILFAGMGRLTENVLLNVKSRSHAVTAAGRSTSSAGGPSTATTSPVCSGSRSPGFKVSGDAPVPAGSRQMRMEFAYDGGGLAEGGTVTLYVDGQGVGEGRVNGTQPMIDSTDETADVGVGTGSPVSDDYTGTTSAFTGTVHWVQIDLDEASEDLDHLITPEERLRIAMARQ